MEEQEPNNLLAKLRQDYPDLRFLMGKKFTFRPPRTIIAPDFAQISQNSVADQNETCSTIEQKFYSLSLLHELGHAVLGHRDFATDIERIKMERAAWEQAREFCKYYGVEYDEDFVEEELDSYRDWLHQRSKCSQCAQTRFQGADGEYHCPFCDSL